MEQERKKVKENNIKGYGKKESFREKKKIQK